MHTYIHVCMCVCTLPPELLLPLPLLGAPGACCMPAAATCQQLLHHINEVYAVHDQCLQLQLQHMQLILAQLNGFQVSACVPCGNRHRDNMAKEWVSGVAVCGWVRGRVGGAGRHMGKRVVQWRMHVTKIEAELHSSSIQVSV